MMHKDSKIMITGSNGMVGKCLINNLRNLGYTNLYTPTSKELNLKQQFDVEQYFLINKFDYVFHLAAKVGGIQANIKSPATFLYDNLMIESNVIEAARKYSVKKLLFLGSSCIYPKDCTQPMKEEYLLTGKPEPTNEGYAIAKIVGLKLCEYYNKEYNTNFISLMPCNIYGFNDHFETEKSHVISALITKFHNAKINQDASVEVWGTGNARREFIFVEDVANAAIYFMNNYNYNDLLTFLNIGIGSDVSIKELAETIKKVTNYKGEIIFNTEKPEGMARKVMDVSKAASFGWKADTQLTEGLKKTYEWYLNEQEKK